MDSFNRIDKGKEAEQKAALFLKEKGLHLLQSNYRCHYGEIDLIMKDKDHIVFVEVRFRHRTDYGNALESINKHKINKLIKTAPHFLQAKKWLYTVNSRFDIVTIHPAAKELQLEWLKNAFWVES